MKAVISAGKSLSIEIKNLADELKKRGVDVSFVVPELELQSMLGDFWNFFKEADLIYYRNGFGEAFREELSSVVSKDQIVINRELLNNQLLSNKLYQAKQVNKIGIKIPKTVFGRRSYNEVVEILGSPFVFKTAYGSQGKDVYLVKNEEEYQKTIENKKGDCLSQEYIPNTGDFRIFVINGSVYNLYKRIPAEGSFKANIHQGGSGETVTDFDLRESLSKMSLTVAKHLNLDVTGIDIIQSSKTGELFFIEANVNPGWKGLDTTLGTNTSGIIADWFMDLLSGS